MRTFLLLVASAAGMFVAARPAQAQFFAPYGYYRPFYPAPFYRPPLVYAAPPPVYYRPPPVAYAPPAVAYAAPAYDLPRSRRARRPRRRAARRDLYR